jgi:hypothetical protein
MLRNTLLILLLLNAVSWAQDSQRRLVRLESRIYGWYAVVEPAFDRTIGHRKLYKVSGKDEFLKGLEGRLVVLEGVFSEGGVHLPALAPPPISVGATSQRRVFLVSGSGQAGEFTTEAGYRVSDPQALLDQNASRQRVDLVVEPTFDPNSFRATHLIARRELVWEKLPSETLTSPLLLDLTVTQDLLDVLTRVGLNLADLQTSYQGLELELSQLRIQLPDGTQSVAQSWELQGSLHLSFQGTTSLAETSFVVGARPVVEGDVLKLKPDWERIQIEGQLPFSFVLSGGQLGTYASYLPDTIPLLDLTLATAALRDEGLLSEEGEAHWYLLTPAPGTARLTLAATEPKDSAQSPLSPGRFRLVLGQRIVDRLIKRQVAEMLDPESPYRPEPPIEVGKALFISIVVEEIFVRNLEAGYRDGAFRFADLVIDVGWRAGPVTGLEPLLSASGYIVPRLATGGDGESYWSWDLRLDDLVVRSDKIPGSKDQLAEEFVPQIEESLGPKLADKQKFPSKIPLPEFLPVESGSLEITTVEALQDTLKLEGRVTP